MPHTEILTQKRTDLGQLILEFERFLPRHFSSHEALTDFEPSLPSVSENHNDPGNLVGFVLLICPF
jgi:hypothetical protein